MNAFTKSTRCQHPDFKFGRQVLNKTNTLAGTPEYLAPEMIDYPHEHDLFVDWWALGVMVYAARLPAVGSNGIGQDRKAAASLASLKSKTVRDHLNARCRHQAPPCS